MGPLLAIFAFPLFLLLARASPSPAPALIPHSAPLPPAPKSFLQSTSALPELVLDDLVLISTVSGDLHALERSTGRWLWQLDERALNLDPHERVVRPLVGHRNGSASTPSPVGDDGEAYILEPTDGGQIYILQHGPPKTLSKLPLPLATLVDLSPFTFPGDDSRMFSGSKEASLVSVDLRSGRVTGMFGSGKGWCRADMGVLDALDDLERVERECDEDVRRRGGDLIYLGKTDYRLSIASPSNPDNSQSLHYSTFSPSQPDKSIAAVWAANLPQDGRHILALPDGSVQCRSANSRAEWVWEGKGPVAQIFDLARPPPTPSVPIPSPTILPHPPFLPPPFPAPPHFPQTYLSRLPGANGALFALSEAHHPLVQFAPEALRLGDDGLEGRWTVEGEPTVLPVGFEPPGVFLSIDGPPAGRAGLLDPPSRADRVAQALGRLEEDLALGQGNLKWLALGSLLLVVIALVRDRRRLSLSSSSSSSSASTLSSEKQPADSSTPPVRSHDTEALASSHTNRHGLPTPPPEMDKKPLPPPPPGEDAESADEVGGGTPGKKKRVRRKRGKGGKGRAEEANGNGQGNGKAAREDDSASAGAVKQLDAKADPPPIAALPVEALVLSEDIIGYGSHGTVVFKGSLQGRAVAVKRLLLDFTKIARHEVDVLRDADEHPNVVRYFLHEQRANFLYIALELCAASLADIIERPAQHRELVCAFSPKSALRQIASGVRHLHALHLVHRDLKPANILVAHPRRGSGGGDDTIRLVISDMGLCKKLEADQSSFAPTAVGAVGTSGWRAPEVLRGDVRIDQIPEEGEEGAGESSTAGEGDAAPEGKKDSSRRLARSLDIFALGVIFYYVLTNGVHCFGERYEREMNIIRGEANFDLLDVTNEEGAEALDLIRAMLSPEPRSRPTASTILIHPYWWSPARRLAFLQDASDRFEIMDPSAPTLLALESGANEIVGPDWHRRLDRVFIENLGKFRKYDGRSCRDLLRALRNKKHHYQDLPDNVKRHLGPLPDGFLAYFTRRFPNLLLWTHHVVSTTILRNEPLFASYFSDDPFS